MRSVAKRKNLAVLSGACARESTIAERLILGGPHGCDGFSGAVDHRNLHTLYAGIEMAPDHPGQICRHPDNRRDAGQFADAGQVLALALTDRRMLTIKEEVVETEITKNLRDAWVGMPDVRADDGFARLEFCL